jgi:hypothetical protein
MSKVLNQQSFHDGKVVLYRLSDRLQNKWLCRLKVPDANGAAIQAEIRTHG